jgi:hypothetical protein
LVAWFTLATLVVTFIPAPFSIQEPKAREERVVPRQSAPHNGAGMNGGPL